MITDQFILAGIRLFLGLAIMVVAFMALYAGDQALLHCNQAFWSFDCAWYGAGLLSVSTVLVVLVYFYTRHPWR